VTPSPAAPPSGSLRFELRTDLDAASLAPLWRELEQRADPPMFLSWHWIGCWLAEAGIHPVVLLGYAGERLVLLGVLATWDRRGKLPMTVGGLLLHTTGDEAKDVITIEYNGFLTDSSWAGRADTAALHYLTSGVVVAGRRRDELHLRNIIADPAFDPAVLPAGVVVRDLFRKPSWHVDLAALRAAGTPYLDSLSANTRQQLRRAMRHYEQRGPLTARRARDVPEAMDFLVEMKRLHQLYWTGKGEPGAFAYPFLEAFERRLIETSLTAGAVELVRVCCGDETIGYLQNLVGNGRVLSYQSGIDYARDPKLKPGLVCHVLCIEMHLREGAAVYDFMAGAARYKASLGTPGPDLVYRVLERPTAKLRLERALRRLVHRFRR
jgi:CelD/BcsL family acetyltransferase involved in cellulose biosynthesis